MLSVRLTLCVMFLIGAPARAQSNPLQWSLASGAATVVQGRPFTMLVRAQIPFGWHLYSTTQAAGGPIATLISVNEGEGPTLPPEKTKPPVKLELEAIFALNGVVSARNPDISSDPNFPVATETYSDSVTFIVPMVARKSGRQELRLRVNYQACTSRYCLPATTKVLSIPLLVSGSSQKQPIDK